MNFYFVTFYSKLWEKLKKSLKMGIDKTAISSECPCINENIMELTYIV